MTVQEAPWEVHYRQFQHVLPDSLAWRILQRVKAWFIGDGHLVGAPGLRIGWDGDSSRQLEDFFFGLSRSFADARGFVDLVYLDLFPETTRELAEWEFQFGLTAAPTEAERRAAIDAAWKAQGGQDPRYLQDIVQAAGFDVYIHEWWSSGPGPYVPRDPRLYTEVATFGSVQCGEPAAVCGEPSAQCNGILANDVGYLVNTNFTPTAPPPVPDDSAFWPYFLYWGGAVFPAKASVPAERRQEFERLILKLCPVQQWLVTLVDYP